MSSVLALNTTYNRQTRIPAWLQAGGVKAGFEVDKTAALGQLLAEFFCGQGGKLLVRYHGHDGVAGGHRGRGRDNGIWRRIRMVTVSLVSGSVGEFELFKEKPRRLGWVAQNQSTIEFTRMGDCGIR
jgi:hypothetical protein